jgi:type III secretion system YopN/LcrE/InvE/MxiC family regulator
MASINTPGEAIRTNAAMQIGASSPGTEQGTLNAGRNARTGETVMRAPSAADAMDDAKEELGLALTTRGKGDFEKFKVRHGQGTNFEALARIADYYDKLPDLPSDERYRELVLKFQQFEDMFRFGSGGGGGGNLPTADDIRELLASFDGDVTHQFAVLEDLRMRAARAEAPAAYVDLIDTVRSELRQSKPMREVMAGFAAATVATEVSERFGSDPQTYRDSYRSLLREAPNLGRVFDEMRNFSLSEDYEAVLDSFVRVAGHDLDNLNGASSDPVLLGVLLKELDTLKKLRSALDDAGVMLAKIDRIFSQDEGGGRPDALEITSRLFHFVSSPVATLADADRMMAGFGPEPPDLPVVAMNLMRDLHASLPDAVFPNMQSRAQQGQLLMTLSERFVGVEEDAYGG